MQVESKSIDDLIPYAKNSRTHSDAHIAQIAASIKEFGFTNALLIDGENVVIAGHGRLEAARKLKMDAVPCVVLDHMTDAQKRAYIIADNKLALNAGWDDELLALELEELMDLDFSLDVIGFDADELADILRSAEEVDFPQLADGDKEPYQQMTFTLHDDQAEQVKLAIEGSKGLGGFVDTENENSNGNALARICETYNGLS